MRWSVLLLGRVFGCCAALLAPLAAQAAVEERAFVSVTAPTEPVFVGQVVALRLRIGLEERLATEQLIQLFRQKLDVAVRLETPWAALPDGLSGRGAPPGSAGQARAVVDGALAGLLRLEDEVRGSRNFHRYETAVRVVARRPGRYELPAPVLHFAWASAFDEDFFGDPVPRDRNDARIEGELSVVSVEALPAAGRPPGFDGLVGSFTWSAVPVEPRTELRVGDVLAVEFRLAGTGDLKSFEAPEWRPGGSFHARGVREVEAGPEARAFRYELVALRAGAVAVPAVALQVFVPGTGYRALNSEPLRLQVDPRADGAEAIDAAGRSVALESLDTPSTVADPDAATPVEAAPIPGVDVLFGLREVAATRGPVADFGPPRRLSRSVLLLGLAVPWLVAAGLWLLRRRTATREIRRLDARRRTALRRFRRALRDPRQDRGHALACYLADWLGREPAAVIDPQLPPRLWAVGLETALADDLDATLDRLARARFGGEGTAPTDAELVALATATDRSLRSGLPRSRSPWAVFAQVLVLALVAMGILRWGLGRPSDTRQSSAAELSAVLQVAAAARPDPADAARDFAAGDVAAAHATYLACLDAGVGDPATLAFDLGNCAHALGRPAESVLWYHRALRAAPRDFEARANLALVDRQLGLSDGPAPTLGRTWLEGQLAGFAAVRPGRLLLLAVILQCAGWWWLLFRSRRRAAAWVVLLLGLGLGGAVVMRQLQGGGDTAVALRADVRLLAEPHPRAAARGSLAAGDTLECLEASPRWVRARIDGVEGWVEASALRRLQR